MYARENVTWMVPEEQVISYFCRARHAGKSEKTSVKGRGIAGLMNVFICLFHLLKFIDFRYTNYLSILSRALLSFFPTAFLETAEYQGSKHYFYINPDVLVTEQWVH